MFILFLLLNLISFVSAEITEVSVFRNRAQVKREQKFNFKKGANELWFKKLPIKMDKESLKVLTLNSKVKIVGMSVKEVSLKNNARKEIDDLELQLTKVDQRIALMQQLVQTLNKNYLLVDQIKRYYSHGVNRLIQAPKEIKTFSQMNGVLSQAYGDQISEWMELLSEYQDLYEKKANLNQQKSQLQGQFSKVFYDVSVAVIAKEKSSAKIGLLYMVRDAGWAPEYELNMNSKTQKAELFFKAFVWQKTSENWDKVSLSLQLGHKKSKPVWPSLHSYRLNYRKVEKVKTIVQNVQQENNVLATESGETTDRERLKFTIDEKISVGSDGMKVLVPIKSKRISYQSWVEVVAKQRSYPYQKARVQNPYAHSLYAGRVSLSLDGEFFGHTQISDVSGKSYFYVGLGQFMGVRANRFVHRKKQEKGLIASKQLHSQRLVTSLSNDLAKSVKLRVYEQIPKSQLDEVKVRYKVKSGKLIEDKEHPSWYYWDANLAPYNSQSFEVTLEVEAPKDFSVQL